ncbi:MAG TPA: M28 family metallopeptidase [Pyrinomonadaceae bacterium]|nr:M28 family metallopeptidase [Pyrinomonadaceae bacterium]
MRAPANLTLAVVLAFPFGFHACSDGSSARNNNKGAQMTPAASPAARPDPPKVAFDGERALEHVRKQVEMGPRPAGSAELAKTRDYIVSELKSYGLSVNSDAFRASTPIGERQMVNVTAELPGESNDVIILASHYDTKLFKEFRFVGANDAGSSTGALLELARVLATRGQKPRFTYWFVFFDGEEAFCEGWEDCGKPNAPDNTYGSRRYAAQLKEKNELRRVRAMILLDMVGYKDLRLGRDEMSTQWLLDVVWQTARELGYGEQFVSEVENVGGDDHEPFLRAGVDALDIIQLDTYPYWHTAEDTLDKISPRSLKIVGEVVLASLPHIEERLLNRRSTSQ